MDGGRMWHLCFLPTRASSDCLGRVGYRLSKDSGSGQNVKVPMHRLGASVEGPPLGM
jgi:hypothetical protein